MRLRLLLVAYWPRALRCFLKPLFWLSASLGFSWVPKRTVAYIIVWVARAQMLFVPGPRAANPQSERRVRACTAEQATHAHWRDGMRVMFLLGAILIAAAPGAAGILVGVDFGAAFTKVAAVVPGRQLDLVLNDHSKRKTPTAVAFASDIREFGEDALVRSARAPASVFRHLPVILAGDSSCGKGLHAEDGGGGGDKFPSPHRRHYDEALKAVVYELRPEVTKLQPGSTAVELAAHWLQHVKTMVQQHSGVSAEAAVDAVITVPAAWDMCQREALLAAARVANVHVLAVVSDAFAAATHHLRSLSGTSGKEDAAFTKLIVDVGASKSQACVARFNISGTGSKGKHSCVLLGCKTDRTLSGNTLDNFLFERLKKEIIQKKPDARLTPRATQRLLREAERVKTVLSANKEAFVNLPNFFGDDDFSTKVSRSDFEAGVQELVRKHVTVVVSEAVAEFGEGRPLAKFDGVEIIGGASRTPIVQREVAAAVAPLPVGQHLNADEAVAMGAAFVGAVASSSHRVAKNFGKLYDSAAYSYVVRMRPLDGDGDGAGIDSRTLLNRGDIWNGTRTVSFRGCHDLSAELVELGERGAANAVRRWNITGVNQVQCGKIGAPAPATTVLTFQTPSTGVITLQKAVATAASSEAELDTDAAAGASLPPPADGAAEEKKAQQGANDTAESEGRNSTASGDGGGAGGAEAARKKATPATHVCRVRQAVPEPGSTLTDRARERLTHFTEVDREATLLAAARNSLETLIYSKRDALRSEAEDALAAFVSAEERAAILALLAGVEDWLYENAPAPSPAVNATAARASLEAKTAEVRKALSGPESRATFAVRRKTLENDFRSFQKLVDDSLGDGQEETLARRGLNATRAHLIADDFAKLRANFTDALGAQEKLPRHADPAVPLEDFRSGLATLARRLRMLLSNATTTTTTTAAPAAAEPAAAAGERAGPTPDASEAMAAGPEAVPGAPAPPAAAEAAPAASAGTGAGAGAAASAGAEAPPAAAGEKKDEL